MATVTRPLRWGILSAGEISSDWAHAFHAHLSPKEHLLIGIAARNRNTAAEFATLHKIPKVFDSYADLVRDAEIDVVYIGSVHPFHLSLGKLALENGKHVLCEKPLCVNTRETKELIEFAHGRNLFLMEAIWTRFFPAYIQLRKELEKGTIGDIYQVNAGMGVNFQGNNWREWDKSICAGGVLDIGTYTCQFATFVFGGSERPEKILAGGHLNEHGVDESSSATVIYSGGRTATLQTHMKVEFPNEAIIIGTKGIMKIGPKFWAPTELTTPTEKFKFDLPVVEEKLYFWNTQGLAYQCEEVRRCILNGLIQSPFMSHEESIILAEMRETIRKQIGVYYSQDS